MSTKRKAEYRYFGKGPGGRPRCRWCGVETEPPRKTWCSDACVHEYRMLSDSAYIREHVFRRDQGVCELCGLDTVLLERVLGRFMVSISPYPRTLRRTYLDERGYDWVLFSGDYGGYRSAGGWVVKFRSLWEVDHKVPVVEGGGECGMDNLRTLCRGCHKRETAALRKRRTGWNTTRAAHPYK